MSAMRWLVTGSNSGLGHAIAVLALGEGEVVVGTVRSETARVAFEALAPGRAFGVLMEARDPESVTQAVATAERLTGGIDVLVANAGRGLVGALEETSLAEIRELFEINVFGAVSVIQAVLPGMRMRGAGHIVNVTSVSGLAAWVGTSIYGATKYAMECIGETLANEVREHGIKVTNVAPGGLRTDFAGRSLARTACRLDAYDGAARDADRAFAQYGGQERGDPARVAAAILAMVRSPEPPVHLLLGEDALHYAEDAIGRLQADIDRHRAVSLSTHFD
jgi:NAD(P)-dependent dehydrogenase (short-subunit alcohol dehydrogenase family)